MQKRSAQRKLRVMIGFHDLARSPLPDNTILITPVSDGWNDFGNRTHISFAIQLSGKALVITDAYFGFLSPPPQDDADFLSRIVEKRKSPALIASVKQKYFTMLRDMEDYRRIVKALGPSAAQDVLLAVNDIVAVRELAPADWLDKATESEVFTMSFTRSQASYFAFRNAGPVLRGLQLEKLGAMSPSFALEFQLAGVQGPHRLKFDFDHKAKLPKRIAVVIGKNGVGKSESLGRIVRALIAGSGELVEGRTGGRPSVSRVLAFAPTNETESVFPSDRLKNPRIWYRRYSLNRSRLVKKGDSITDLIIQVARSEQAIGRRSRWRILVEALEGIRRSKEICLLMSAGNSPRYLPITRLLGGGEQYRLELFPRIDCQRDPVRVIGGEGYPLSSGEISLLKFAAQVSLNIENGTLLLLDEPETHLHPNFISRFVSLLDRLLADTGSAAIIATHSVYFVREVFREQVTVLRIDDDRAVHAEHPTLKTFGADVGAISYFVFGEDEPSTLATQVKNRLLKLKLSWDELFEEFKGEVSLELLNTLRAAKDSERPN
jgi:ABC-type branched-subunit amino acid transport system ATPase component